MNKILKFPNLNSPASKKEFEKLVEYINAMEEHEAIALKYKKKSLKKIIITVPKPYKANIFHYIQLLFLIVEHNSYKNLYLFKPNKKISNKNFIYLKYLDFEIFFIYEKNFNYRKGSINIFFEKQEIVFERSVSKLIIKKFKKKNNLLNDQKLEIIKKFSNNNNQINLYNDIFDKITKNKKNNLINIYNEKFFLRFYKKFLCN